MGSPLLIGRCSDWVRYFWRGILQELDWVGFKYFKPMLIQSTHKCGFTWVSSKSVGWHLHLSSILPLQLLGELGSKVVGSRPTATTITTASYWYFWAFIGFNIDVFTLGTSWVMPQRVGDLLCGWAGLTVKQGLLPVCSVVPSCLLIKKPSLYLQVNMWKCLLICCYAFSTVSCVLANVKRTDAIGQPTTTGGYNCYMPLDFSQILNAVVSLNMFCGFILITYYG